VLPAVINPFDGLAAIWVQGPISGSWQAS